ncbi:hypothetical protein [Polaribacter sp. IC073]|uniref:hypothetical protein n=1 Tax=Polaribacter sp. IC073 TaxID=2508540 RepID=UPI0011BFA2C1|nr:hypothetical protein [Polaribacter sp. IC073]TXD49985.1 hypothetical protein ES045_02050 [Polaribacter sp. IC073]
MIDNKDGLKPKEIKKNSAKESNKTLESLKKQAAELKEEAKEAFDIAKGKINENLSDENIEKAKVKLSKYAEDAKEVFDDVSKKASEFAEDPKEEIEEATKKTKTFFQKLFRK